MVMIKGPVLAVQSVALTQDQEEKNGDLEGGRETEKTARAENWLLSELGQAFEMGEEPWSKVMNSPAETGKGAQREGRKSVFL